MVDKTPEPGCGAVSVALLLMGIFLIPVVLVSGLVLQALWGWYVVPQFHLAPLVLGEAIGLGALVSYVSWHYHPTPKGDQGIWRPLFFWLFVELVQAGFVYGLGLVVHLLMR